MLNPFFVPRCIASCLLMGTLAFAAWGHDGVGDHAHEHDDNASGKVIFTTREGGRVLPLAKEEDVFHFVVYGDRTGGVPAGLKVLEQAVVDTNLLDPDLVMTVGDLIQGYNEAPEWMEQMNEFKEIMERLHMRWFPVAGNHDVYWRGTGKAPEGQHESNYEKHFGPLWYSFRHKNSGFIVLYSDEGDAASNEKGFNEGRLQTMSPAQLAFLQEALENHKGLDHVFLFLHHPRWIGRGYKDGNWDVVHNMLKTAGNVSAVFAGHIHQMRFDGPKDGIAYYTLATTGGHLSADIAGAGYLHHLNVVTVRPESVTVAALPIGAVIDPKEFTPEFIAEVELARSIRPVEMSSNLMVQVDGSAAGEAMFILKNPSPQPIDATVSFDPAGRDWTTSLDHDHFTLAPGETKQLIVHLLRRGGASDELTLPRLHVALDYLGRTARISLPAVTIPVSMKLAAVPAAFFKGDDNRCLNVTGEKAAVRIESSDLQLPDGPFTLEAWVRPEQSAGNRGLTAKTEGSEFAFFMDEGVPQFDVHLNGKYVSAIAKDVLPNNQWTHLAGVFDGAAVKLFINGKLIDSKPGSGERKTNQLPLFIGADPDPSGQPVRPFLGQIDEVRISTGAVYQDTFIPSRRLSPEKTSVLLLHLDRKLGPFVLDHSPSAVKGTLGTEAQLVPVN